MSETQRVRHGIAAIFSMGTPLIILYTAIAFDSELFARLAIFILIMFTLYWLSTTVTADDIG